MHARPAPFRITIKQSFMVVFTIALLALTTAALLPQSAYAARADNYSNSISKYSIGKNVTATINKYDVTGDKKADKLELKMSRASASTETYKTAAFYVNGKKVISKSGKFVGGWMQYMKMKNGTTFVYVRFSDERYDGIDYIYKWANGKMKLAYDLDKTFAGIKGDKNIVSEIRARDNEIVVHHFRNTNGGGIIRANLKYGYKKGSVYLKSNTGEWINTRKEPSSILSDATKSVQTYKSVSGKKKSYVIGKGMTTYIKKVYVKGSNCWLFVQDWKNKKKTGWVKIENKAKRGLVKFPFAFQRYADPDERA